MKNKHILLALFFFYSLILFSQDKGKKYFLYGGLELNTKYVWRGIPFGNSPTLFPYFGINYNAFNFMAFGGYSLNGSHSEVDLFLTYSKKGFEIGLADYYFPKEDLTTNNYFNFRTKESSHACELYAHYSPSFIPLWLTLSSFVYGNDRDEKGSNIFSSYIELGYYKKISKKDKISVLCGVTPYKGLYADKTGIVNLSVKYDSSIILGRYKLPFSSSFIINPNTEKVFLSFSICIHNKKEC